MLFINSFVSSGVLESEEEAKITYTHMVLISTIALAVVTPLGGKLADKAPPYHLILLVTLARIISSLSVNLLETPTSVYAKLSSMSFTIFSWFVLLGVMAFFQRNLPENIRGLMMSINAFCMHIILGFFDIGAGTMFDKSGSSGPWNLVAILDTAYILIIIVVVGRRLLTV